MPSWLPIPYVAEDDHELLSLPPAFTFQALGYRCGQCVPSCLTSSALEIELRGSTLARQALNPAITDSIWNVLQRPLSAKLQLQSQTCYNSERLQRLMNWNQNWTLTHSTSTSTSPAINIYTALTYSCAIYFLSLIALSPPPNYKLDCKEKKLNTSVSSRAPCIQKADKFNFKFSV